MMNVAFNPIQQSKQHVGFGINTTVTRELWEQLSPTVQKQTEVYLGMTTLFDKHISATIKQLDAYHYTNSSERGDILPQKGHPTDVHGFITKKGKKFLGIFRPKEELEHIYIPYEEFIKNPVAAIDKIIKEGLTKIETKGKTETKLPDVNFSA